MNRRQFTQSLAGAALGTAALSASSLASPGPARTGSTAPFKFSVMLWTVYGNLPFEQRLEKMAEAGYGSVELGGEFTHWTEEDFRRANNKKRSLNIEFDAMGGMSHSVCDPGFLATLRDFLPIADRVECRTIITLSGRRNEKISRAVQHQACVETLKRAGDIMAKHGSTLLLESLDPEESPHCFLNTVSEGFEIIRKVDNPHVRFLYDLYHEQIAAGNLIEKLEKNIEYVNLVHVAGVPGRHELNTGEINYPNIFRKLAELKYNRYVAMEFLPTGNPVESLRAARELAIQAVNG